MSSVSLSLVLLLSVQSQAKLVVHEWGTFTSLVASNGEAQNGMYYEDEELPDFVHNFGDKKTIHINNALHLFAIAPPHQPPQPTPVPKPPPHPPNCPVRSKIGCEFLADQMITQKMETPVVYFYSDEPKKVNFNVSFPGGVISQSYPEASFSSPEAIPGVKLKNGSAHYVVNILKDTQITLPEVESTNIYSHARNTASDIIQIGQETEKFIFYRGLGEFKTKLRITSKNANLRIQNLTAIKIPAAFLIYTNEEGSGNIISLGSVSSRASLKVKSQRLEKLQSSVKAHDVFLKEARQLLFESLTQAGLYGDEAQSMLDTWENGYFKTPGLRVLYVLSRNEVEEILPVQMSPVPDQFNRVFVGRIEVLLDTAEEKVLSQIQREGGQYDISQLGRMAQPILLRVKQLAATKNVLTTELSQVIDALISRVH